jgi:hypothetical protein
MMCQRYPQNSGSMTECYHYTIRLFFCDPGGDRTHNPPIKSRLLYLLSYKVIVEQTGYDPVPLDFQSSAMTTSATAPINLCEGWDSNPQSPGPQPGALPIQLQSPCARTVAIEATHDGFGGHIDTKPVVRIF